MHTHLQLVFMLFIYLSQKLGLPSVQGVDEGVALCYQTGFKLHSIFLQEKTHTNVYSILRYRSLYHPLISSDLLQCFSCVFLECHPTVWQSFTEHLIPRYSSDHHLRLITALCRHSETVGASKSIPGLCMMLPNTD